MKNKEASPLRSICKFAQPFQGLTDDAGASSYVSTKGRYMRIGRTALNPQASSIVE